jgi:hypothetical protein
VDGAHVAQPHVVAGRHASQHRGHVVQQQLDGACADQSQLGDFLLLLKFSFADPDPGSGVF